MLNVECGVPYCIVCVRKKLAVSLLLITVNAGVQSGVPPGPRANGWICAHKTVIRFVTGFKIGKEIADDGID